MILRITYIRGIQLFSVTGQICSSKIFAGQNLVLGKLRLPKLRSSVGFRGVLKKKEKVSTQIGLISFAKN